MTGVLLGNPKLLHAQKISQHITGDMAELVAISQKSEETAMRVRRPNHLRKIRRKQHGAVEHAVAAMNPHLNHVSYHVLHLMFLISLSLSPADKYPFLVHIPSLILYFCIGALQKGGGGGG